MGQVYYLIALGAVFVVAGLASLTIRDFDGAGWYVVGAGLVAIASGLWFAVRGGNRPHPPADLPPLPSPGPASGGCPKCGSAQSRVMTGTETTDFYGYDRFILVRPRICLACGAGFEMPPGRIGCYLMIGVAALGVLLGVVVLVGGPVLLWRAANDPMVSAAKQVKIALSGVGVLVLGRWWVARSWRVGRRYWALLTQAEHGASRDSTG
jgi:hypothetical protein